MERLRANKAGFFLEGGFRPWKQVPVFFKENEEGMVIMAMKKSFPMVCILLLVLGLCFAPTAYADVDGKVNWVDGYISAVGYGAVAKGNMAQSKPLSRRAAIGDAYRNLLEMIKGVKIDAATTVENFMVSQDIIKTQIDGVVKGATIYREDYERQPDGSLMATVEMRVCISSCPGTTTIVQALNVGQNNDPPFVPQKRLQETPVVNVPPPPKEYKIIYDATRPVTGIVVNLEGQIFERVLLPVVIVEDIGDSPVTIYSAKSVNPAVIRTHGIVRYADTIKQACKNPRLGDNVMIIPASGITKEKMIVVKGEAARLIKETTAHGNDYLSEAKVVISAQ